MTRFEVETPDPEPAANIDSIERQYARIVGEGAAARSMAERAVGSRVSLRPCSEPYDESSFHGWANPDMPLRQIT